MQFYQWCQRVSFIISLPFVTMVKAESEERGFQKDLSGRNGTDSMPLTFEYIKTNSIAPVVSL